MGELAKWDSFYVIVGSAAGALVGLQFVVLALLAERPRRASAEAGAAFATPNIVHFVAVLLLSAVLRAPFEAIAAIAILLGAMGVAGMLYEALIAKRMKTQTAYKPVFEDWAFHFWLPAAAYGILAASAFEAGRSTRVALFAVGGASLLLLLVGIHNAWDAVTWHVFQNLANAAEKSPE
jgi:hypothetical protein